MVMGWWETHGRLLRDRITSIRRVQNQPLWTKYALKRAEIQASTMHTNLCLSHTTSPFLYEHALYCCNKWLHKLLKALKRLQGLKSRTCRLKNKAYQLTLDQ